jgi:biotin operon repressor
MFHVKQLQTIEDELKRINNNLEKLVMLASPPPLEPKKLIETSNKYPRKFLTTIKGRYRTVEEIGEYLNLSVQTVITYIKLARADGYIINRRGRQYKLQKGQIND